MVLAPVKVLACLMVLACVMVLARAIVFSCVMVLSRVMVLACDGLMDGGVGHTAWAHEGRKELSQAGP